MRRFSQRSYLVTLSEINITPLLDLAFVLLIIFIITAPLLEQSINMHLPQGGVPDTPIAKSDIKTVEISTTGQYALDRRRMPLDEIIRSLKSANRANPRTIIYIRTDENGLNKYLYALLDRCAQNDITRFSLRTSPPGAR